MKTHLSYITLKKTNNRQKIKKNKNCNLGKFIESGITWSWYDDKGESASHLAESVTNVMNRFPFHF